MIYNLTRQEAASLLDVSTRTLDRYIRKGKLSFKKVGNKILLSETEVSGLKEKKETIKKYPNETELIGNTQSLSANTKSKIVNIDQGIQDQLGVLVEELKNKDKKIEEKNNHIFLLQQSIGELEGKLSRSIALPDYTKEKEALLIEKEKVEMEKTSLKEDLNYEKVKNAIFICVLIMLFLYFIYHYFI